MRQVKVDGQEVDEIAHAIDACMREVSLTRRSSGHVRTLLVFSLVIIVIDPMADRLTACRPLVAADGSVAIDISLEAHWRGYEIGQRIIQIPISFRNEAQCEQPSLIGWLQ